MDFLQAKQLKKKKKVNYIYEGACEIKKIGIVKNMISHFESDAGQRSNGSLTTGLLYAVFSATLMCGFPTKHLSWQTNPSPKTRTAQTCGTL